MSFLHEILQHKLQIRRGTEMENPSILYHRLQAEKIRNELDGKVKEINRRIAGHLMVIRKSTWLLIRDEVSRTAASKKVLGVDTKISNAILLLGMKIRLMRGLYIFHYLRMAEGFNSYEHLK